MLRKITAFSLLLFVSFSLNASAESKSSKIEKASIEVKDGTARMLVNGNPLAPDMLFVNLHDRPNPVNTALMSLEIADAAKRGVNIITFTIGFPWSRDGEKVDYSSEVDRWIDLVLAVNPDAMLIPRIQTTYVPFWWQKANPDEMGLLSNGQSSKHASIHSRKWRSDVSKGLKDLVAHIERKYGSHVLGYHPSGQNTGEWFSENLHSGILSSLESGATTAFRDFLKEKYKTDDALSKAWGRENLHISEANPPSKEERLKKSPDSLRAFPSERNVADFLEFRNMEMALSLLTTTSAIKESAPNKLVLVFYGYHMELNCGSGLQESGHLGLGKVMNSKSVDILCSPVTYFERYGGGSGSFMSPLDSAPLHGKMRLMEDDLRTHLSPDDSYEVKANRHRKAKDMAETEGILARNMGSYIAHGTGVWWMDLWGEGWYRGDELWTFLGKLRDAHFDAMSQASTKPEIAVFLDERSHYILNAFPEAQRTLLYKFRDDIARCGAPVAFYLLDDLLDGRVAPAKLNLLPDSYSMDQERLEKFTKVSSKSSSSFIFFWAPGVEKNGLVDYQNIASFCGIKVNALESGKGGGKIIFSDSSQNYDAGHGSLGPSFAVDDKNAVALASYADNSGIALASLKNGNARFIYSGIMKLPPDFLRKVAEDSGVHIYNRQNDVISAGHGYISLHATEDGERKIFLPVRRALKNVLNDTVYPAAKEFSFHMKKGDTILLKELNEENGK